MLPGLSVLLTDTVIGQVSKDATLFAKWAQRAPTLTNAALRTCQQGFEAFHSLRTQYTLAES